MFSLNFWFCSHPCTRLETGITQSGCSSSSLPRRAVVEPRTKLGWWIMSNERAPSLDLFVSWASPSDLGSLQNLKISDTTLTKTQGDGNKKKHKCDDLEHVAPHRELPYYLNVCLNMELPWVKYQFRFCPLIQERGTLMTGSWWQILPKQLVFHLETMKQGVVCQDTNLNTTL